MRIVLVFSAVQRVCGYANKRRKQKTIVPNWLCEFCAKTSGWVDYSYLAIHSS